MLRRDCSNGLPGPARWPGGLLFPLLLPSLVSITPDNNIGRMSGRPSYNKSCIVFPAFFFIITSDVFLVVVVLFFFFSKHSPKVSFVRPHREQSASVAPSLHQSYFISSLILFGDLVSEAVTPKALSGMAALVLLLKQSPMTRPNKSSGGFYGRGLLDDPNNDLPCSLFGQIVRVRWRLHVDFLSCSQGKAKAGHWRCTNTPTTMCSH